MPLVTVKVFERRLDADSEARIIKAMTDALLGALEAEELRDHTWVLVEGYDPHRWGRARQALGRGLRRPRPTIPRDRGHSPAG